MINHINSNRPEHIITVENHLEFVHEDKESIVTQHEVGHDTLSFANALRGALRQDPDIILIGEMRDAETVRTAMASVETGHLVFSTLHTVDADETIHRIIDFFEPHQQIQIRKQPGSVIHAVVSQRISQSKKGLVVAPCAISSKWGKASKTLAAPSKAGMSNTEYRPSIRPSSTPTKAAKSRHKSPSNLPPAPKTSSSGFKP